MLITQTLDKLNGMPFAVSELLALVVDAVQTFILNTAQSLTSTVLTALDTGANYRQAARQVANGVANLPIRIRSFATT